MRTAITLGRTKAGWKILSGPDVTADKQRARYNDLAAAWPDDLLEIRYQSNDGPAKTRTREKADAVKSYTRDAEKHNRDKAIADKRTPEERRKAAEAESAAIKKAEDERAEKEKADRELKAKAHAKAK